MHQDHSRAQYATSISAHTCYQKPIIESRITVYYYEIVGAINILRIEKLIQSFKYNLYSYWEPLVIIS